MNAPFELDSSLHIAARLCGATSAGASWHFPIINKNDNVHAYRHRVHSQITGGSTTVTPLSEETAAATPMEGP
ncbi:hypothetical protein [Panacagrimonas perspica]|uniref:hypothetical protein n=1 Tax=Panacagrimonas perspica TaxID=381431 RepID=UPI00106200F4|nr:hypothetical protein [Panacagrimonas perspica]